MEKDSIINYPMKKYVGLSLFIDMSIAQKSISKYFPYGNIDLFEMRDKVCKNGAALIIRSRHEINHIIGELYRVDERIQLPYSIIKTIELLPVSYTHLTLPTNREV